MDTADANDENPDITSIQFEDGTFMLMPFKVYGYIEQEIERIATDPDAMEFLSLSRIADPPTLAHYYTMGQFGNLCVFASKTAKDSFDKHFPGTRIPDGFWETAKSRIAEIAEGSPPLGSIDMGVGIARDVYGGNEAVPDLSSLTPGDQCGILLQQFAVFALLAEHARQSAS
ncbi:hypothetical protein [Mycobacterium sp. D16Q16]|uniref:hypothetical protein n=1 Tax=Mycobacterium sp. D16Q16 TaxID=1855659 RepID=UPI000993F550|nr:hypothetical protein [Mycobacterium sp. D16Q16]